MHRIGKDRTWKIERKNLNFRIHIKRLNRKTICFSKNELIHDNVIGMCMLEVAFPEKLKTNYGKKLIFSQEMTGAAEIITEDLRLLDRFLNPIRALIKK